MTSSFRAHRLLALAGAVPPSTCRNIPMVTEVTRCLSDDSEVFNQQGGKNDFGLRYAWERRNGRERDSDW
jgi:hypothetical protein